MNRRTCFASARTIRAHDRMSMTACHARTNDRVNASVEDRYRAWQNPESVGRRKKEPRGEKKEMHLVVEHEKYSKRRTERHLTLAFFSNSKCLYTARRG